MSFPPLAGGDHTILSSEYCSGYTDTFGTWNTGFYCPQTGSTLAVYCCGTPTYKYCCTNKPNGTGLISPGVEGDYGATGGADNDYSGATRIRTSEEDLGGGGGDTTDLSTLNLSDVPIIFGVACGVAAVLILVILAGFYLTSCCTHYHQVHQNRKRRSSMPGLYRGVTTANASTTSGLVNLYSPTNSGRDVTGSVGLGSEHAHSSYPLHHSNPPASPDSSDHYQMGGGGGSASLVTTPLDIEWSSTSQYLQQHHRQTPYQSGSSASQPLNLLSNHITETVVSSSSPSFYPATSDNRIHYTVLQTQNRLAVALSGSMNRLSDRPSQVATSYPVNIPLTPPDGFSYPRHSQQSQRAMSPPPQYSSTLMSRSESPPYYPYDGGNNTDILMDNHQSQQLNYLNRTSTLPLSLSRKLPNPLSSSRPTVTSPGPYLANNLPPQPKSILRTSQNYRRVVTNETPPPVPPHAGSSGMYGSVSGSLSSPAYSITGPSYSLDVVGGGGGGTGGNIIAYRNVDSRSNLNQPLLLLESKVDNKMPISESACLTVDTEEEENNMSCGAVVASVRRASVVVTPEEEEDESRDQFDIHDIDSDALSRLIELDLDSKL